MEPKIVARAPPAKEAAWDECVRREIDAAKNARGTQGVGGAGNGQGGVAGREPQLVSSACVARR